MEISMDLSLSTSESDSASASLASVNNAVSALSMDASVSSSVSAASSSASNLSSDSSSSSKSTAEIYKGQSASGRPLLGHFRYEVLETIGQGGQGKVKKARLKLQTGFKMTAIKFVFKNKLHSGSATRLKHEIDFLLKLRHPNIIQLHECYHSWPYREHDGSIVDSVALVQELCSGELMNILVLYKKFTPALALNYFRQLTAGLGHCHAQGIAHRDLKPQNLLLDSKFQLKICDFGYSQTFRKSDSVTTQERLLKSRVGTPAYMPPELIEGRKYDGPAADVWSAGVTLFGMLWGVPPLQRAKPGDWWYDRLRTPLYIKLLLNSKEHILRCNDIASANRVATVVQSDPQFSRKDSTFWGWHLSHDPKQRKNALATDLIARMMFVEFKNRITVAEIQKHPWFRTPPMSQTEVIAVMQHAMLNVHLNRQKQRQMAMKMAEKDHDAFAGVDTLRELSPDTDAQHEAVRDIPAPPPGLYLLTTLVCKATMKPRKLFDTFLRVVCQHNPSKDKGAENADTAITIIFPLKGKPHLQIRVSLYRVPKTGTNLIELRRVAGNSDDFNKFMGKAQGLMQPYLEDDTAILKNIFCPDGDQDVNAAPSAYLRLEST